MLDLFSGSCLLPREHLFLFLTGLVEAQVGAMDEEFPQDHSMESGQPTKRHSRESKKDVKKRKRSSKLQDSSPEGGKSARHSPAIHLSSFEPSLQRGARVSVSVTPVHRLEDPLQPLTPKRTSTPVHFNPASRKIPSNYCL